MAGFFTGTQVTLIIDVLYNSIVYSLTISHLSYQ